MPGDWKPKRNQGQAPGQYEIVRLMTVAEDKDKGKKTFTNLQFFEKPKFGIISKVRDLTKDNRVH